MESIDADWVRMHLERNLNRVLNPAVCYEVLEALRRPDSDFSRIAATLGGDPFIAAKVVGLANLQRRAGDPTVSNIHRAVAVLGTRHVQTLVLAVMLTGPLVSADGDVPRRRDLWRWVFGCAAAGDFLSSRLEPGADQPGGFRQHLIGGLLLGLGPLILFAGLGRRYESLMGTTLRPMALADRERAALGATHRDVTVWALSAMRCPADLGKEARALRDGGDEEAYLWARAIEVLGARAAGLETARAEAWLADALPRLGVPAEQLVTEALPALRSRVRELTRVYDVDLGDWPVQQETRQRAMLLAGSRLEEMLHDAFAVEADDTPMADAAARPPGVPVETDRVTGLLTRRSWQAQLRSLDVSGYDALGLVLLSMDGFARFSDRFGRKESDRALATVATVLRSTTREPVLLGRFGSDEFIGLYDLSRAGDLPGLASQVRELLAAPEATVADTNLTACIGGVTVPRATEQPEWRRHLTRVMDALRRARQQGRAGVHVDVSG